MYPFLHAILLIHFHYYSLRILPNVLKETKCKALSKVLKMCLSSLLLLPLKLIFCHFQGLSNPLRLSKFQIRAISILLWHVYVHMYVYIIGVSC